MFQSFTPYEYMLISMANAKGMDKALWEERIAWADNFVSTYKFKDQLAYAKEEADVDERIMLSKAIHAHHEILKGNPTGFMCNLDATASGIQVMASITGCLTSAAKVNLIDNGKRNDLYQDTAIEMNTVHGCNVTRSDLKQPIMTTFYGSTAQPVKIFGKGTPELNAFINTMKTELAGAYSLLLDLQSLHRLDAKHYQWTLPDGHTAYVPVMEKVDKKVEVAELNKATFTFRTAVNQEVDFYLAMAANVVHSLDAYVVRELFRLSKRMGFHMSAIHDSFWASVNHIEKIRKGYIEILARLAESNVAENILNEISGNNYKYTKFSDILPDYIREANYALS